MAKERRASVKPSEAEAGGSLGFPVGSTVTITEAEWSTWGEAGEKALKRDRKADDPALKLVGDVEGKEDPVTVFLGAGKSERLQPSKDGQYLVIPDDSTASALSDQCNAKVFLDSVFYKDKKSEAYKRHGKMAIHEDKLDDGMTEALVDLKFVAGSIIVKREFNEAEGAEKRRGGPPPSLVADEILEIPGGGKASSRSKKKDEDEDEDEKPTRRSSKKGDDEDEDEDKGKGSSRSRGKGKDDDADDDEEDNDAAEKAVIEALEQPKYRKGLPKGKAFEAVFNLTKGEKNQKAITELVESENWITSKKRPWTIDEDDNIQAE